ncbi:DUF397 domain-containing protein [Streptomyces sp. NPDC048172]|uniref:DUF397 domain-containing protein n=1 Tax=Streptomyces sp. NPDC048172 TaxID=3365505 RepID=UPI003721FB11
MREMDALDWFKSSYSESQGKDCLEVAAGTEDVLVRDTKDVDRPVLGFPGRSWEKFVAYVAR